MANETADVVVIGGGIIGMSIAYELSRHQAGRIVVIEKGTSVGEGSTGASSACLRLRYSHSEVMALALHGMQRYRKWGKFTHLESPRAEMKQTGVVWMMGEDEATVFEQRDRLRAIGAKSEALNAEELSELYPSLITCNTPIDFTGEQDHECGTHDIFLYEEEGGYCTDPVGANQDLYEAASRDGVDVRLRTQVTDIRATDSKVIGVTLSDGTKIDTGQVVNAAGPWCNQINTMAGIEHKWELRPSRAQVMLRATIDPVPGGLPMVGDLVGGVYFRPESNGQQILVGSVRLDEEDEVVPDLDNLNVSFDEDIKQRFLHALHHRIPSLEYRGRVTGVAGMYTTNVQDVHPVVGPTEVDGFYVCNGFSGHGFKLAPAIGSMVAKQITNKHIDGDTDVDPKFLSIHRKSLAVLEKNVLA